MIWFWLYHAVEKVIIILLLMFVAEKVQLLLVISLTAWQGILESSAVSLWTSQHSSWHQNMNIFRCVVFSILGNSPNSMVSHVQSHFQLIHPSVAYNEMISEYIKRALHLSIFITVPRLILQPPWRLSTKVSARVFNESAISWSSKWYIGLDSICLMTHALDDLINRPTQQGFLAAAYGKITKTDCIFKLLKLIKVQNCIIWGTD